ncbi:hypothetical protein ABTF26_21885, partial [Acinetobacter baumannii]
RTALGLRDHRAADGAAAAAAPIPRVRQRAGGDAAAADADAAGHAAGHESADRRDEPAHADDGQQSGRDADRPDAAAE